MKSFSAEMKGALESRLNDYLDSIKALLNA